ncbi:ABC transporter ATP-binding protein [Streptomyces roseoverticillatus]|uniref:ABC transporter ATP-binding protein n=1 Tax=Streptomyces roseoverticillatus TaxID=66429 RepID=A0ABV3J4P8_9ACTN
MSSSDVRPGDGVSDEHLEHGVSDVHLEHVVAGYRRRAVTASLDLTLTRGVHVLLGRNGAGKTTLMRTLAGILPPLSGRVRIGGADLAEDPAAKRRIGLLSHRAALAPQLTVRDNLDFWATVQGLPRGERARRVADAAGRFDITALLDRRTARLSRGQLQRADLARLLLTDPQVLLLDEPLTGLDPVSAGATRELVRGWAADRTVLYSTHSVPEALTLASGILVLKDGALTRLKPGSDGSTGYEVRREPATAATRDDGWTPVEVEPGATIGGIVAGLVHEGVTVSDIRPVRPDTETAIHRLLGGTS